MSCWSVNYGRTRSAGWYDKRHNVFGKWCRISQRLPQNRLERFFWGGYSGYPRIRPLHVIGAEAGIVDDGPVCECIGFDEVRVTTFDALLRLCCWRRRYTPRSGWLNFVVTRTSLADVAFGLASHSEVDITIRSSKSHARRRPLAPADFQIDEVSPMCCARLGVCT